MASTVINLRADERRRALIDRAAEATGKNRSEFMLEAACR
ncbi:MAG: type II toxin -antitoxin system TacA 1-like antitoxin, partial [Vulcanimicrobiaceae bacterium]